MLHVYHVFHILRGEGFKIQLIRNVKVGADCFRIVIDNNRFIAFPGKSPGSMHGAIVEFDTLTDTDGAGTQNENLLCAHSFPRLHFPRRIRNNSKGCSLQIPAAQVSTIL